MGYFGLSNWVQSDSAADFRYTLQDCFKQNEKKGVATLKKAVRTLIMKELKDKGNCYNTEGAVNIALVMEDEGAPANSEYEDAGTPVFSKLLSKKEFVAILKGLDTLLKECDGYVDKTNWDGEDNIAWHRKNYKRMRDSVFRKTYKE